MVDPLADPFLSDLCKIPELRKKSRIDYLKKRVVDKVEELDDDIRDWDYLFEGVK